MKVYMVGDGSYSDFEYIAAFSTEKKAQDFIKKAERYKEYSEISGPYEFEVDSKEIKKPEKLAFILTVEKNKKAHYICQIGAWNQEGVSSSMFGKTYIAHVNYSENEQDMIKAGMEKINMMIAREEGI